MKFRRYFKKLSLMLTACMILSSMPVYAAQTDEGETSLQFEEAAVEENEGEEEIIEEASGTEQVQEESSEESSTGADTAVSADELSEEELSEEEVSGDELTEDDEELSAEEANAEATYAELVFSDREIGGDVSANGVTIDGTNLTISNTGTYVLSGSCSSGSITVAKKSGDVTLSLNGLSLTNTADEAAISVKNNSYVTLFLTEGSENVISDAAGDDSYTHKHCISSKLDLTIEGSGKLTVNGNRKNGIKSDAGLFVKEGVSLTINCADNGMAADDVMELAADSISITTVSGDAIRSLPDEITDSARSIITIDGGNYDISAGADGIQVSGNLIINDGSFDITTGGGSQVTLSEDADSCKGLKSASTISVNGGDFTINSADDAIHSDDCVYLTGGNFDIKTGDDGAHADSCLYVGYGDDGKDSDLYINIEESYEGLEGGNVYLNYGNVYVTASDDGVNAAGGSSNGTDPGSSREDQFTPGGPGGKSGPGMASVAADSSDYNIFINGGNYYVNVSGDGLDSNGSITVTGGNVVVFGQQSGGDNDAIDFDGTLTLNGGRLFGAGGTGMQSFTSVSGSQSYIDKKLTVNKGSYIIVKDNSGNVVASIPAVKNIARVFYSAPGLNSSNKSSYTVSSSGSQTEISEGLMVKDSTLYVDGTAIVKPSDDGSKGGGSGNEEGGSSDDRYTPEEIKVYEQKWITSEQTVTGKDGNTYKVEISHYNYMPYTGKAIKQPSYCVVSVNGVTLDSKQYKLSYKNNKLANIDLSGNALPSVVKTPVIRITFKKEYKTLGKCEFGFDIMQRNVADATITSKGSVKLKATSKALKSAVINNVVVDVIKNKTGNIKLKAGRDVDVYYLRQLSDGSYENKVLEKTEQLTSGETYGILLKGKGNFAGESSIGGSFTVQ